MKSGMFQSTRPHGARRSGAWCQSSLSAFQSTRPHGARQPTLVNAIRHVPFQSTRPHGARLTAAKFIWSVWTCFNPRARTGRDSSTTRICVMTLKCFNPRARTGRDLTKALREAML